jgi:uncharacterized protein (TIGR02678 family)
VTGRHSMTAVERPKPAEDAYAAAERRRAARALLMQPLLHGDGPNAEDFRLVRRHRAELTRMFADGLGYRLTVDPQAARLFKPGLGRDPSRPLEKASGAPFTPRAYALLCLTVAALTMARKQLLIDELVAAIRSAAAEAGLDVDLDQIGDRRALYAALSALISYGVLRERDGDLERWTSDGRTPTLLDVRRDRLSLLVSAPLAGSATPDQLLETAALPSAAGGARVAIRRRLVESPILSTADLPGEYAEWWRRNRNREREWFRDRLGLEVELRAEGAIAVDPEDELTDVEFPAGGSAKHFALLLLGALTDRVRSRGEGPDGPAQTWAAISGEEVDAVSAEVFAAWSKWLKREHRERPEQARQEAVDLLVSLGLVERGEGAALRLHAAAARYAPRPAADNEMTDPPAADDAITDAPGPHAPAGAALLPAGPQEPEGRP